MGSRCENEMLERPAAVTPRPEYPAFRGAINGWVSACRSRTGIAPGSDVVGEDFQYQGFAHKGIGFRDDSASQPRMMR